MKLSFLGEPQLKFLREGQYIKDNETPQQRYAEIIERVRSYEEYYQEKGLADRLTEWLDKNYIHLSTPVLSNFGRILPEGKTPPLPASCNIVTVEDSIDEIWNSDREVANLSKLGAGVGADFTRVCQKGTLLSEGFHSNSKLDYVERFVDTAQKVSQLSIRRGYVTPFLGLMDLDFDTLMDRVDVSNPDKNDVLVNNTVGIILPKGFDDMVLNDKEVQRRYLKALSAKKKTGKVYFVHVDNMNKNSSEVYKKLELNVETTNICCVTGDQLVATEDGFKTVKELSDSNTKLRLFDNEEVHDSTAMLYRGYADVYKITLANGMTHTITSNHELVVRLGGDRYCQKSLDTGLKIGDKVLVQTNKGLFGKEDNSELAFLLGLFLGDGSNSGTNGAKISLWEDNFDLLPEVEKICKDFYTNKAHYKHHSNRLPEFYDEPTYDSFVKKKSLNTTVFNTNGYPFKKGEIPEWVLKSNEKTHWQLLRGLFYTDGTVGSYNNSGKSLGDPVNLSLTSINLELLRTLQIICANLGLKAKIYKGSKAGISLLPKNDGTGEYGAYNCKESFRLVISNKNDLLRVEENTKFLSRKGVFLENREYRDNSQKSSKIVSIEHMGKQDVYCPTVDSDKHLWICNGLITSNTEFVQPLFSDMTSVCVLSALNLVHWDEIKKDKRIIRDLFIFLDIVNEEYVRLTANIPALKKAHLGAKMKRDIGAGTLGFHEYLQSKEVAFGDVMSRAINKEIYSTMREVANQTTRELAEKLGPAPYAEKAGLMVRNCSLMMIAPNKSTSFLANATSLGIEPFMSNIYPKKLAKIQYIFKNKHLERVLETYYGKNDKETWKSIQDNNGSVQHLDFLSKEHKDVFRTFSEISPKDIIDLASDRQVYIDMAQSLNLVFRKNYTMKDIYDIHKYAWEKGIKTLYYGYSSAHASLEKEGEAWDEGCISCAD